MLFLLSEANSKYSLKKYIFVGVFTGFSRISALYMVNGSAKAVITLWSILAL